MELDEGSTECTVDASLSGKQLKSCKVLGKHFKPEVGIGWSAIDQSHNAYTVHIFLIYVYIYIYIYIYTSFSGFFSYIHNIYICVSVFVIQDMWVGTFV